MYQLPLLVVTSPKSPALSIVRLEPGKWTFTGDVIDTELVIRASGFNDELLLQCKLGDSVSFPHPVKVQVHITKPGTEKHITVLATHQRE